MTSRRVACGLLLALILGSVSAAVTARQNLAAPNKRGNVQHLRRLPLEGAANFRDLGGYPTADGHHVKWGLVYRSGHLANLTASDYEYLNSLGITLVCDLRSDSERKKFPTIWQGNPKAEIMVAPVMKDVDVVLTPDRLKQLASAAPGDGSGLTYDHIVLDAPEQYGRIIRRLAYGALPAVTHCTAGKDRTGVFSAILLTMLGVPRDVVIQDYMLTGEYALSDGGMQRAVADWPKLTGSAEPADSKLIRALYQMHPETITATFATIDRAFRSFEGFVHEAMNVTDQDVATLRRRLLE